MHSLTIQFGLGELTYQLWDYPVVDTWSRMMESYYNNPEFHREELYQSFVRMDYQTECDKLRSIAEELIIRHEEHLHFSFADAVAARIYTRDKLNWLHEQYESIRTKDVPFELPEAFNDQIHLCERFHMQNGMVRNTIKERPRIRTRFIHKDWGASAPWKLRYRPGDEAVFRQPTAGRIYMCYCEVGKPPFSAYRDRDAVTPVPWTQYGPAFYVTFQNWGVEIDNYEKATKWLEEQHGPGVYWMGEPELGILTSTTVEDAFAMVKDDPVIRGIRWNYND